ncbi:MAG: hypothetical protein NWE89_15750 [Candidatus Bathyarchaeota archaeon]|nr:hypothetical protein [Candidatus Bathyarchaeota archaeon]
MKRHFINPFEAEGEWFKGNVHAHTTKSDGTRTPEQLVEIYKEAEYDFLSITDHSIVVDVGGLGDRGFLLIPGEEICVGRSQAGTLYHLVGLGVEETLPFRDFDYDLDPQSVIDYINEAGGISILAHPYWSGLNHSDMMKLKRYHGVEIYNTSCEYERNTGLSSAHIDGLIVAGRKPWIYATDDHHGADRPNLPLDACGAWINVKAESLSIDSIMESIRKGLFYSSTGPEIKNIAIDDDGVVSVECSPVKYISFVSTPSLGMKFYAEAEPLTGATYPGRPRETYVRVEVTDYEGRTAWTNPIYNI